MNPVLDTLLLMTSLSHPPVSRPLQITPPGAGQLQIVQARPVSKPDSLSTCFQAQSGSCWSE